MNRTNFLLPAALCIALLFCGCGRIGKDITIDGADVSGLLKEEAEALVSANARLRMEETRILLRGQSETMSVTAAALCAAADAAAAVEAAGKLTRRDANRALATVWTADADAVSAFVEEAAQTFSISPVNAAVERDASAAEPFSYTRERAGAAVNEGALAALLSDAVSRKESSALDVPVTDIPPRVTVAALSENRAFVSSFTTSFAKSPYNAENRVFNIKKAAGKVNGIILEPGEAFDCNRILGDRCAENGWRQAPGIVNGAYESEYGGGVCQLSSTLFNAVLMADLPVSERHPHSWPMGYVPIGRDAAISTGGKNLRFENATAHELHVFARVDEKNATLTVSLYGEPLPEERYIELASEQTGWLSAPGEEFLLDESLPQNTRVVFRQARRGRTAATYKRTYAKDGTLLSTALLHEDAYRSIDGVTYLSTDLYEA